MADNKEIQQETHVTVVQIKQEPKDMQDFAEDTMNELLGWYGYDKVAHEDTKNPELSQTKATATLDISIKRGPGSREEDTVAVRILKDGQSSHSNMTASSGDEHDRLFIDGMTCSWCQKQGTRLLTLETSSGRKNFCSEQCFTHSRRASFKRNKVCDWCKHVRHTVNFVDFQDGENQLQFCSDKCLNQYKMNIFCRETREHLKNIVPDTTLSEKYEDEKQILITPDLWLKENDIQDAPLNLKTRRRHPRETLLDYGRVFLKSKHESEVNSVENDKKKTASQCQLTVEKIVNNAVHNRSLAEKVSKLVSTPTESSNRHTSTTIDVESGIIISDSTQHARRLPSISSKNRKSHLHSSHSSLSPPSTKSSLRGANTTSPIPTVFTPSARSNSSTPRVHLPARSPGSLSNPAFTFPPVSPLTQFPFPLPPLNSLHQIVPPATCFVPYPIILPFPVPIPIPLPIESTKWEKLKEKCQNQQNNDCQNTQEDENRDNQVIKEIGKLKCACCKNDNDTNAHLNTNAHQPVPVISRNSSNKLLNAAVVNEHAEHQMAEVVARRADHAYSMRRSLILDAPSVPQKRFRSPSPETSFNAKRTIKSKVSSK